MQTQALRGSQCHRYHRWRDAPLSCQPLPPIQRGLVKSAVAPPQQVATSTSATSTSPVEALKQQIRVGHLAEQGLRPGMEDELHVDYDHTHGHLYAACFDGHGGPIAAQWLRKNLMGILSEQLTKVASNPTQAAANPKVPSQFAPAFQAADEQLLAYLESLGGDDQEHAGATATVLLLWKDRVVVANVGDSQAYLCRKGKEVSLTIPHRVYGQDPEVQVEIKRIEDTGGWVYDGRVCNVLAVSRAFGDWEFKGKGLSHLLDVGVQRGYWSRGFATTIEFKSDPIIVKPDTVDMPITQDDEFLVLSTDGLWDVMPPREVMQWARKELQKGLTPEQVARSLVHEALKRQQPQGLAGLFGGGYTPPTVTPLDPGTTSADGVQVADSLVKLALKRHTSDNTSVVVIDLKGEEYWKAFKKNGGGGGGLFSFFGRK